MPALKEAHSKRQLPHVVLTARPPGCLAGTLHRRQQQADQHADDGDHHEQFDEGEAALPHKDAAEGDSFGVRGATRWHEIDNSLGMMARPLTAGPLLFTACTPRRAHRVPLLRGLWLRMMSRVFSQMSGMISTGSRWNLSPRGERRSTAAGRCAGAKPSCATV